MAGVLALLLASLAAAPAPDVARALEKVYSAGEYQTELPGGASAADSAASHPEQLIGARLLLDLGPLAEVLRLLVWAGAVVGAILVVVYLAQRLVPGARGDTDVEEPGAEPPAVLSDAPLRDAQALAREGRFASANRPSPASAWASRSGASESTAGGSAPGSSTSVSPRAPGTSRCARYTTTRIAPTTAPAHTRRRRTSASGPRSSSSRAPISCSG